MTPRLLLIVSALLLSPPAIAASIISGSAYVIDGDSLSVSGISVRLFGIDALEGAQTCTRDGQAWPCGEESASQLRALIGERSVRCQGFGVDDYGRTLAICHAGSVELNSAMVSAGWATAFRKYSTLYVDQEEQAKSSGLGIWSSQFITPDQFRTAHQLIPAPLVAIPRKARAHVDRTFDGCVIKGNRNRKGQWIYHLPGMPYYDATRPEEIFCTEAEARAAGYRRAIVR